MSKQEIQFAKTHLRNHLATLILPHVSDGIWSIYDNAKLLCEKNREIEKTLRMFQNLLTRVATWTDDTLTAEVSRIISASNCEYLDELITGVFLAYMRAFAAMQYRSSSDAIDIDFEKPSLDKFIHELYKQVARVSWEHAYLYKTYGIPAEQQAKNRKDIAQVLEDSLDKVLDSFLPWKDIAKNYFKEVDFPTGGGSETTFPIPVEDNYDDEEETNRKGVTFSEDMHVPPMVIGEDVPLEINIETLDESPASDEKVDINVSDESESLTLLG